MPPKLCMKDPAGLCQSRPAAGGMQAVQKVSSGTGVPVDERTGRNAGSPEFKTVGRGIHRTSEG